MPLKKKVGLDLYIEGSSTEIANEYVAFTAEFLVKTTSDDRAS